MKAGIGRELHIQDLCILLILIHFLSESLRTITQDEGAMILNIDQLRPAHRMCDDGGHLPRAARTTQVLCCRGERQVCLHHFSMRNNKKNNSKPNEINTFCLMIFYLCTHSPYTSFPTLSLSHRREHV